MDKKRIHEMLEKMTEWALSEMQAKGKEGVDTKEMGEVIDMVKDLADAEKSVWEKCYYESIVEAMEKAEEEEEALGRMGYDRWRNSKGRFAPKGHGHETSMAMATGRAGFTPDPYPYYDDPRTWTEPWRSTMGYDEPNGNNAGSNSNGSNGRSSQSGSAAGRMGYTPDDLRMGETQRRDTRSQYQDARRHYQETGSQEHKMKMDEKADEYLHESIDTMRDIFMQADPKMQQKMRNDISNLFREMGGK